MKTRQHIEKGDGHTWHRAGRKTERMIAVQSGYESKLMEKNVSRNIISVVALSAVILLFSAISPALLLSADASRLIV